MQCEIRKLKWLTRTGTSLSSWGVSKYFIQKSGKWWVDINLRQTQRFDTADEAKAFAQEHFESEVMKYLNVPEKGRD